MTYEALSQQAARSTVDRSLGLLWTGPPWTPVLRILRIYFLYNIMMAFDMKFEMHCKNMHMNLCRFFSSSAVLE